MVFTMVLYLSLTDANVTQKDQEDQNPSLNDTGNVLPIIENFS